MSTHLISNQGYLDSVRYLGLTTIDGICELIDNSLDANAKNINISISQNDKFTLTLEDDGDGIEKENIDKVLSFGGRLPNKGKNIVGRFGWGLPSAACCQSMRTELFSRCKQGISWAYSYIDLNELALMSEPIIPDAIDKTPPNSTFEHGVVVKLDDLDNPDFQKLETLKNHLSSKISETYRHYLNNGITIKINDEAVRITDPLMLISGCKDSDDLGYAKEFAKIEPIVVDNVIDPDTQRPAQIDIKIVLLDLETIKRRDDYLSIVKNKGFNVDNQGFYVVRQHRQIARALTLGIFQRHNDLNYFRAEISFPPILDKYFGVQTNKSRFSIHASIKEKIAEKLKNQIVELRKIAKEFQRTSSLEKTSSDILYSEKIAADVDSKLKPSTVNPSPEEIKKAEQQKQLQKAQEIEKINKNNSLSEQEKATRKNLIENKFQSFRPFQIELIENEYAPFYDFKPYGDSSRVLINIAHPFYTKVYERAIEAKTSSTIDLLLFSLTKAESIHYSNDQIREFYKSQRMEWSVILKAYLDELNEPDPE